MKDNFSHDPTIHPTIRIQKAGQTNKQTLDTCINIFLTVTKRVIKPIQHSLKLRTKKHVFILAKLMWDDSSTSYYLTRYSLEQGRGTPGFPNIFALLTADYLYQVCPVTWNLPKQDMLENEQECGPQHSNCATKTTSDLMSKLNKLQRQYMECVTFL